MVAAVLSKIGIPVLVGVLKEILGGLENPAAKTASQALGKVEEALKDGQISHEQLAEMNRHVEKLAQMQSESDKEAFAQVNQSLRAEIASEDRYVRRMRPTFGYLMALTWAAQMFGIAYVIIFDTDKAGVVMAAMGNLSAIWAVGLSVLGIYVYKRSEDKKSAGVQEVIFWNPAPKVSSGN